jgi:hypothetical protein
VGLTAIFSAAVIPIIIMGSALEVGKLVCASWLKANWERAPRFIKYYMTIAVIVLMLITSMGIFGFLSKAHNDQNLVSGDVQSKISIFDEKIKTAKENIEAERKQLKQMDEAVDQIMARSTSEGGADKANAVRKSQQRDRIALAKDIETQQKLIGNLNDEAAPIRAEVRKVEAEVGPIKYIAAFLYGTAPDESMLERAVTWIIILIVIVFDPLAVIMLLGAQMTFAWQKTQKAEGNSLSTESDTNIVVEPTVTELDTDVGEKPTAEELHIEEDTDLESAPWQPIHETGTDNPIDFPTVEELVVPFTEESELDKWNKMIEEAERNVVAEEPKPTAPKTMMLSDVPAFAASIPQADLPVQDKSKKKTYMIKDPSGQIITKEQQ